LRLLQQKFFHFKVKKKTKLCLALLLQKKCQICLFLGIDLALLSLANHSIMTLGTFGMWGAILAGGDCLIPTSHRSFCVNQEIFDAKLPGWEEV
jgi:hypothetical protein